MSVTSVAAPAPAPGDWDYRAFTPARFDDFRAELLALYEPPLRAKKTRAKMRHALDIVAGLLGPDGTTADLTPALIARFIAGRPDGESPHTTHSLLSNIRTACSYCKSQGYIRTSPFDFRKKWIRVSRATGKKHHSQEDIRRVLELLKAEVLQREGWSRWRARRLLALASTVAYTGLRKDEAIYLRVEDVDLPNRMLYIVDRSSHRLKTEGSAAPVPMPEALVPILENWLAHRMTLPEACPKMPPDCPYVFCNVTRSNAWSGGGWGCKALDKLKAARAPGRGRGVHIPESRAFLGDPRGIVGPLSGDDPARPPSYLAQDSGALPARGQAELAGRRQRAQFRPGPDAPGRRRTGRRWGGGVMSRSTLPGEILDEMRGLWARGVSSYELGRRFGLDPARVWKLCELYGGPEIRAARAATLAGRKAEAEKGRKKASGEPDRRRTRKAEASARRDSEVRRLWSEGWMGKDIASRFKLARSKVSTIVAGMPRALRDSGAEDDAPTVAVPRPVAPIGRTVPVFAPPLPLDPADRLLPEPTVRGSAHGRAKLDEPSVVEMRRLRRKGWSTGRLAKHFNVGRNTTCYALSGVTWSHVPGAIPSIGGTA